jgi:uncharacterized protein YxeA
MKKFIYTIAIVTVLISLTSCTADEIKTEPQSTIVKQDVSAIEKPITPGK